MYSLFCLRCLFRFVLRFLCLVVIGLFWSRSGAEEVVVLTSDAFGGHRSHESFVMSPPFKWCLWRFKPPYAMGLFGCGWLCSALRFVLVGYAQFSFPIFFWLCRLDLCMLLYWAVVVWISVSPTVGDADDSWRWRVIPDDDDRATSGLWLGFWFVFGLGFRCWLWVG